MTWRYQAVHRVECGDDVYGVHEVYEGHGRTEDPVSPFGETKEELIACLRRMLNDVETLPVLEEAE